MDTKMQDALKLGVEEYTGRKVESMQVCADPQVEGTYAIRTKHKGIKEPFDWLIVRYNKVLTAKEISDKLQENEYSSWPPVSGNLKFLL